jgi:HPt (histidine-containing phosphotransfer) domain-containing protein/CheY-like chemotaxis protein
MSDESWPHGDDQIMATIRQAFLEDSEDRLAAMDTALAARRAGKGDGRETLAVLRREAHTLKGMGAPSGFPFITAAAHRFESYLTEFDVLPDAAIAGAQRYLDAMIDVVARRQNPDDDAAACLLRALPLSAQTAGGKKTRQGEALLVIATRVLGRAVARQLGQFGIHAVATQSVLEGMGAVVRGKPDLIVVSPTLADITGIDFVRALGAMAATRHIPVAVLTSSSSASLMEHGLPANVPLIRIGEAMEGDLKAVLARCRLA